MRTYNKKNIIASGVVLSANRQSSAMELENIFGYSIQVVFTGTPTGAFKLQFSDDPVLPATGYVPTNWTDIPNSIFNVTAAGNVGWNSASVSYNFVRVAYVDASSGASTAIITSATFNGKGV